MVPGAACVLLALVAVLLPAAGAAGGVANPAARVAEAALAQATTGKIAFTSNRGGPYEIYVMNPDGSGVRKLVSGTDPDWSPDGSKLAFVRGGDVYVVKADGGGERRVTSGGQDAHPSWSPDGRRIAFARGGQAQRDIYVVNEDGTGLRRLTNGSFNTDPAWSPKDGAIAFWTTRDGNAEIYKVEFSPATYEIKGIRNLTRDPGDDRDPAWSPDGGEIAFSSDRSGNLDVFTMRADGSGLRRLTDTPASEHDPFWCLIQLAKRIFFESDRDGNFEIYSMKPDGSDQRRLTFDPAQDVQPVWALPRCECEDLDVTRTLGLHFSYLGEGRYSIGTTFFWRMTCTGLAAQAACRGAIRLEPGQREVTDLEVVKPRRKSPTIQCRGDCSRPSTGSALIRFEYTVPRPPAKRQVTVRLRLFCVRNGKATQLPGGVELTFPLGKQGQPTGVRRKTVEF